jgi:hypothetical protein
MTPNSQWIKHQFYSSKEIVDGKGASTEIYVENGPSV